MPEKRQRSPNYAPAQLLVPPGEEAPILIPIRVHLQITISAFSSHNWLSFASHATPLLYITCYHLIPAVPRFAVPLSRLRCLTYIRAALLPPNRCPGGGRIYVLDYYALISNSFSTATTTTVACSSFRSFLSPQAHHYVRLLPQSTTTTHSHFQFYVDE